MGDGLSMRLSKLIGSDSTDVLPGPRPRETDPGPVLSDDRLWFALFILLRTLGLG